MVCLFVSCPIVLDKLTRQEMYRSMQKCWFLFDVLIVIIDLVLQDHSILSVLEQVLDS